MVLERKKDSSCTITFLMARVIPCPVGISLEILQQKCKSNPISLSQTKNLQQMLTILAYVPGINPLGWPLKSA